MKRTLCASFVLSLLIVGLPFVSPSSEPSDRSENDSKFKSESLDTERDTELEVRLLASDGQVFELNARDYLIGVVSAEMPASFEPEALKAQAVAARSYLRRYLTQGSRHEGADICASSDCCQAYKTQAELKALWGDRYDAYIKKITKAVDATDGEYLSYDGKAVLAAFHSSSAGQTENGAELWGDVPYLVSVVSPEEADDVPNYVSTASFNELDFRDTLLHLHPEADFTAPASDWLGEADYTESGRVRSIVLGGVSFTGQEIRTLFSLRSTAFSLAKTEDGFLFTVTGYGHGVGMSQYGANVMAKDGSSYREILAHYYPDTTLILPR